MVYTVGHSTRPLEEFVSLLRAHGVTLLVDVRTVPRSRHNPQFNQETLPQSLAVAGIQYRHMAGLGGLRHTRADSPNHGWRNASFRGFADYMQSDEFAENIETLLEMAVREQIAVMCAEVVPWRCHRSLIADALLVRGARVAHIMGKDAPKIHELTPFARVAGTSILYPALEQLEEGR
jgi:uncharacterized protein (DUF488 family)